MGQARIRKSLAVPMVYHHTNTMRTNQIWMDGYLLREGEQKNAVGPGGMVIQSPLEERRACIDFPPLVWFTTRIDVPKCIQTEPILFNKDGSRAEIDKKFLRFIKGDSVAIGFRAHEIPVVPWPEHFGYKTKEGMELNESAIDLFGDNPEDWWVSESRVDVMLAAECWLQGKNKLVRSDKYLSDVKRMVGMCRENPEVFIAPSWINDKMVSNGLVDGELLHLAMKAYKGLA